MITVVANQKGGVGKTTTAANIGVLFARRRGRVLVVDTDPQFALTRQLGLEERSLGVNLVDVLAGRASAADAIVPGVQGVDVIPAAASSPGFEMSLVGELGRERFLHDALEPVIDDYDEVVIDTPPNLGLLTVNALVCSDCVLAPVSAEDEGAVHGILELRGTIAKLAMRLGGEAPRLIALATRWSPTRVSSRTVEDRLAEAGLAPAGRIRLRSALVAEAAAAHVPVARQLRRARLWRRRRTPQRSGGAMSVVRRRGLLVDDPLGAREDRSPTAPSTGSAEIAGRLRDIPLSAIHANPAQPRKRFDEPALAALAHSIRERGVLQPVIVRPVDDGYELVAGERRWRAAGLAEEATIPALVDDALDPAGSLELALIENIVREDLSPIEQARTFSVLLDDLRMTSAVLAKRIGRSREDIANTMRLLALPDEVVEMIDGGALTKGHGKVLLTESDHHRRLVLARQAGERGWSVRALEAEIGRAAKPPAKRSSPDADQCAVACRLERAITRAIGCDATAKPHRSGFQILLDHPAADRLARALGADLGALRMVAGTRCTWNTSYRWSCAKSCTTRRTSGSPSPRKHWRFEASVIPTTRPPRSRSGSRDHTLAQLGEAGAGVTKAKAQTGSTKLIWTRIERRTSTARTTTTTPIKTAVIAEPAVAEVSG